MDRVLIRCLLFAFALLLLDLHPAILSAQLPLAKKDSLISDYESQLAEIGVRAQQQLSEIDLAIDAESSVVGKTKWRDSLNRCVKLYRQRGIHLYQFDQIWYSQVMPVQISKVFGKYLSDFEKEYVKLKQLDCDAPVFTISGELTDPKRIPANLLICDRILKKGPGALKTKNTSPERVLNIRSEIENLRTKYLFVLYFGTSKKPSTDPKTNIIKGEFWNPMYEFTRKYPNNPSSKEILQFIQMLEENNYRLSPELKENLLRFRKS